MGELSLDRETRRLVWTRVTTILDDYVSRIADGRVVAQLAAETLHRMDRHRGIPHAVGHQTPPRNCRMTIPRFSTMALSKGRIL